MLKFATAEILSAHRADSTGTGLLRTAHRADFSHHPVLPGYLYVRSRAISSRCNDNFDEFPADEIVAAYRTFIGKPVFVNHVNHSTERARGVIIDAALHRDHLADGSPDTWVEVLMEVDGNAFPKLAKAILAGEVDRTSMGCDVAYSVCSACGNKATNPAEYCAHIPGAKGTMYASVDRKTGKRNTSPIREICYGLHFFENSLLVEPPADPTAAVLGVTSLDKSAAVKAAAQHATRTAIGEPHPGEDPGHTWTDPVLGGTWTRKPGAPHYEDNEGFWRKPCQSCHREPASSWEGAGRLCRHCDQIEDAREDRDHLHGILERDQHHRMDWEPRELPDKDDRGPRMWNGTCRDCGAGVSIGLGGSTGHPDLGIGAPVARDTDCPANDPSRSESERDFIRNNHKTMIDARTDQIRRGIAKEMADYAETVQRAHIRDNTGLDTKPYTPPERGTQHLNSATGTGVDKTHGARTAAYHDGTYTTCDQGHCHWDPDHAGSAGLLIAHHAPDGPRVLLGRRARWVQQGGTWSFPGGALEDGENPVEGATREAGEELGNRLPPLTHVHTHTDDHGGWKYHTVIAHADHPFHPEPGDDGETDEFRWVHPDEFPDYNLHPGFAAAWPHLAPHIRGERRTATKTAAYEGLAFEHEDIETGGSKWPTKRIVHAIHPEHGRIGTLSYYPPKRHGAPLAIDRVETDPQHRNEGVASALMDHVQRTHPASRIEHGDRTDAGRAWWEAYSNGASKTDLRRGRTTASAEHDDAPLDEDHRLYLRFGNWPKDGRSINNIHGYKEDGVSVYDLNRGRPVVPGDERGYGDDGNDTHDELLGRIADWRRGRHPAYLVRGEMTGFGGDGEPLLHNVEHVHDWTPEPHHLHPAWGHEIARDDSAGRGYGKLAAGPKHENPADHPFFKSHPVSAAHVVAHWAQATDEEKAQGKRWYADAGLLAKALGDTYAGGDVGKAAGVISAYSPRQNWAANMHNAARSLAEGRALGLGEGMSIMGQHQKSAQRIIDGEHYNTVLKAPKTNAFAALIHHGGIDPDTKKPMKHVVIDRHALSVAAGKRLSEDDASGFPSSTPHYYNHVAKTYTDAADAISNTEGHSVAPHEVQAVTWMVRIRKNREEDRAAKGGGGKGRVKNQDNNATKWRDTHRQILPGGAGDDNMHLGTRTSARRRVEAMADGSYRMMYQAPDEESASDIDPDSGLHKHAYGETKAPAQVDTLRDDECDVCGNKEGWDGMSCPVCLYVKPPSIFTDPDTSMARTMDLRGVGDAAAQTALQQGADAVPGGQDQADPTGEAGMPVPGAEPVGGEAEDPQDATADGDVRTLGDGAGLDDETTAGDTADPGLQPVQVPPSELDVLTCPECGFQTPAGPALSTVTEDPSAPASAGPVAGDVCPNCGKAVLVSTAEAEGLTAPPEAVAVDPEAADAEPPPPVPDQDTEPAPEQPDEEPVEQDPADDDEDSSPPPAKKKSKSPAVKRVSSRGKRGTPGR